MTKTWSGIIAFVFSSLLFFTPLLSSLTVVPLTNEELTKQAEVIVVAKVLSAYYDVDASDHTFYTFINVRVDEYLKGRNRSRNLVLKTIGGAKGELGMYVDGAADFYKDEKVMLFLARRNDGSLFPVGFFLGKFSISVDRDTGREILMRNADGRGQYFSQPKEAVVEDIKLEQKVFFNDFHTEIQRILQKERLSQ